ncbi:conserved hypothetical protein [Histoplasma capsulatum G186AR]|uniref:AT DNA binding protein n=2 Tax=Ajellomyces capsulatus TaxID=5037 RepID=C0NKV8_AJECG|nr:uncharacterized protein HCBG_03788 [Histoplasma capsulatum G186AR]EEH08499.1 conserved hypothetical protein [Histoplasma capsulatum G186AR]KAG5299191.1 AT DNA binding protein [Histoplasma capsulatum]QSS68189.1 AT DNA binding protein [Histoplasma capsulatum G186AR]
MDDKSDSSSPDPLGYPGDPDYILSSATKPFLRRGSTFSPRKSVSPIRSLSPTKAGRSARSIRFEDIILPSTPSGRFNGKHRLSPTKTATLNSEGNTSPWRIRVTVEAEQDEGDENFPGSMRSNVKSRRGRTTKVPLKDENSPSERSPKKRRTGKSDLSQRVPTPRKRRSRVETPSGNTSTTQKTKRGRPRKSQATVEESNVTDNKVTFADSVRKKMQEEDPFLDIATEDKGTNHAAADNTLPGVFDPSPVPDFIPTRGYDRSSPTPNERTSSQNPDSRFGVENSVPDAPTSSTSSPYSPRLHTGLTPENTIDAGHTPGPQVRGYPTPTSSSLLEEGITDIPTGHTSSPKIQQHEPVLQPLSDPTNQHREFDSILESEGFSMVSLNTLPSASQQLSNSFQRAVNQGMINSMKKASKKEMLSSSKSEARHSELSASGNSDKASGYMSSSQPQPKSQLSPQMGRDPREIYETPGTGFSSQQPPEPAIQPSRPFKKTRLVKLVRVIRAGIALQGVLNRRRRNSRLQSPFSSPGHTRVDDSESVKKRLDALFQGFGVETERELRAGLRFGEKLAKLREVESRRRRDEPGPVTISPMTPDGFATNERNIVGHPERSSSGRKWISSDSAKERTKRKLDRGSVQLTSNPRNQNQSPQLSISREMARREALWQRERDAISHQIQEANSSQVIVIDSDRGSSESDNPINEGAEEHNENDPTKEGDYEDIWQQEARETEIQSESASFIELSREELIKPPRRVLPSPWKRNGDVVNLSQDEEGTPGPGPYWKTRTNGYPILPSGKSQTARFREQNVESSSLLGSPESATRRFYLVNNVSSEGKTSRSEQLEDLQFTPKITSSPTFVASYRRDETSRTDDQISDANAIHHPWAPSPESSKIDMGHTSPDNVDVYSEPPVEDGHLYPELPSNSVHSSRNSPVDEEQITSKSESQNSTPRARKDDQRDREPSTPTGAQQERRPLSWFNKLTDLAPSWLTTPASRKVERSQPEAVSKSAFAVSPNRGLSIQSASVQGSPTQNHLVSRPPTQPPPIESSPIQELPVQEPIAEDGHLRVPPTESRAEGSPAHRHLHKSINKMTVDAGTQFSSPLIPKPKPRIRGQQRQPPAQHKALPISGYFTDDHYTALRHLYHKAKRSPGSFRYIETLGRKKLLGQRIYSADGVYSRRITEMQIAIVDKFRRNLSVDSRKRGGTGKVEWSEAELLRRLFSIIVGEHVRRERKRDLEQQLADLHE